MHKIDKQNSTKIWKSKFDFENYITINSPPQYLTINNQ